MYYNIPPNPILTAEPREAPKPGIPKPQKPKAAIVVALKLELDSPHALKVKYKGSQQQSS